MSGLRHDFIIVGSGVSGGRLAYDLTRAGAKCLLLEAGKAYQAKDFPKGELDYSCQLYWNGGLELTKDARLGLLRGKCLGGTSVLNQALLDRFDDDAWDDWKNRTDVAFFRSDQMEGHYQLAEQNLSVQPIPEKQYNPNAKVFIEGFNSKGYQWKPLRRAYKDCAIDHGSDCMACLGGCPRESKQSSLVTTIRWAQENGLEIETEFEVLRIQAKNDQVTVFGHARGEAVSFKAKKLILAGGALGNVKILQQSGFEKTLPALGRGFACHPQVMSYGVFDEPVDAHRGAFQAVKSADSGLRKKGFKFENVFAPPVGTAMLIPGFGRGHQQKMQKYRYLASMEAAIRDDAAGFISVNQKGRITVDKKLTGADRRKLREGLQIADELLRAAGAKEVIRCDQAFGLHLMGGCPIGTDPKKSVVNPEFRLHGVPNVFIADSSIFPAAPGINPSFTIMALSQRASTEILKD